MNVDILELARVQPERRGRLTNGGWPYDRYKELEPLDVNKTITVADLKGPGSIRQLCINKHDVTLRYPEDLTSRGVVVMIYFDDATEPAVMSPLADFFGDGCNGQTPFFASEFLEHQPEAYHCYFPMPFRKRAVVRLRNDTARNLMSYTFVEWEPLSQMPDDMGYFHASYAARSAQIHDKTVINFLSLRGTGHLVGRQFSIETDEPIFEEFQFVMEGNNEVDIDGEERVFDYLGTECSFNFGWGWRFSYIGPRAGAPLVKHDIPAKLSTYRFHHHLPIRFKTSLDWKIDWSNDEPCWSRTAFFKDIWKPALEKGGCWAHFNTVHYWYQTDPGGYKHQALAPMPERIRPGNQAQMRGNI